MVQDLHRVDSWAILLVICVGASPPRHGPRARGHQTRSPETNMTFILDQERSARSKGTGIFAAPEKVVYKVYSHTNSRLYRHTRAFWWLGAVSGQIVVSRA